MDVKKPLIFIFLLFWISGIVFSERVYPVGNKGNKKSNIEVPSRGDNKFFLPTVTIFGEMERDLLPVPLKFLPHMEKSSFIYLQLDRYYTISKRGPGYISKSFFLPDFYHTGNRQNRRGAKIAKTSVVRNKKGLSYSLSFSSLDVFHSKFDFSYPLISRGYRDYSIVYQNWTSSNFSKSYSEIYFKMQGKAGQDSGTSYFFGITPILYLSNSDSLGGLEILGYWANNRSRFNFSGFTDMISLSRGNEGNVFLYSRTSVNNSESWLIPLLTLYISGNLSDGLFNSEDLIGGQLAFRYGALTLGGAVDYVNNSLGLYPIVELIHRFDEGWRVNVFGHYFNYLNRDAVRKQIVESMERLPLIFADRGMDIGINVKVDSGLWNESSFNLGYLWGDFLASGQQGIGLCNGGLDLNFRNSPLSRIVLSGRFQIPIIPGGIFNWETAAYSFYGGYLYDFNKLSLKVIITGGVDSNFFYNICDGRFSNFFDRRREALGISVKFMGKMVKLYNYSLGIRGGLREFRDFFCILSLSLRYNR